MSSSWNSVGLEVLYQVIGWIAFAAWSFSFYPQVVLNYKRKRSVRSFSPFFSPCQFVVEYLFFQFLGLV